jgi:restriction endonuclease S subunit
MLNLSPAILGRMLVPVPSRPEQGLIADYLDRETVKIDGMVAKVENATERLQEYRTALITAAVTGKIDVRGRVAPYEPAGINAAEAENIA